MSNRAYPAPETFLAEIDEILRPYILTTDASQAQALLEQLMTDHAEPVIQRAIRKKLQILSGRAAAQSPERNVEDICSETRLNLLRSLRLLKERAIQKPIRSFRSYVYTIVFQVWDKQLRDMNPQRWRLKNQVRYCLNHHRDFALWESGDGVLIAGKRAWKGNEIDSSSKRAELLEDPQIYISIVSYRSGSESSKLIHTLNALFTYADGPMELDDVVSTIAKLRGISDSGSLQDAANSQILEWMADHKEDLSDQLEKKLRLQKLWSEICLLPERQRLTIVLSLRDNSGCTLLPLLPLLQIASISEIAAKLGFSPEEFAEIWNRLPLDDLNIAEMLKINRQQVINLRKSARERLGRRTKIFGAKGNLSQKFTSKKPEGDTP